jgi:hypothetical protein
VADAKGQDSLLSLWQLQQPHEHCLLLLAAAVCALCALRREAGARRLNKACLGHEPLPPAAAQRLAPRITVQVQHRLKMCCRRAAAERERQRAALDETGWATEAPAVAAHRAFD